MIKDTVTTENPALVEQKKYTQQLQNKLEAVKLYQKKYEGNSKQYEKDLKNKLVPSDETIIKEIKNLEDKINHITGQDKRFKSRIKNTETVPEPREKISEFKFDRRSIWGRWR